MIKTILVRFNVIFIKKMLILNKMNDIKQSELPLSLYFLLQVFSALVKDGLKETDKSSSSYSPALRS